MHKNRIIPLLFTVLMIAGDVAAASIPENQLQNFKTLEKSVESSQAEGVSVVEFFSFYCPPCYSFSQHYGIDKAIRESLPAGKRMVKYHAGFLGEMGYGLTEAWSVAMVMGIEDKMEPLLFDAVQVSRTLKTPTDIREVFIKAGISGEEYDRVAGSKAVADMTKKQERLFSEYGVTGTPSVFINGKYRIDNGAFQAESVRAFRDKYIATVKALLNADDEN